MKSKKALIISAVALAWASCSLVHHGIAQAEENQAVSTITGITKP